MCFKRSFEGDQGGRITDGSRYIVPGSRCRLPRLQMSLWKSEEA